MPKHRKSRRPARRAPRTAGVVLPDRSPHLADPAVLARRPASASVLAAMASPPLADGPGAVVPWNDAVLLHAAVVETLVDAGRDDLLVVGAARDLSASMALLADGTVPLAATTAQAIGVFCGVFAPCSPVLARAARMLGPDALAASAR